MQSGLEKSFLGKGGYYPDISAPGIVRETFPRASLVLILCSVFSGLDRADPDYSSASVPVVANPGLESVWFTILFAVGLLTSFLLPLWDWLSFTLMVSRRKAQMSHYLCRHYLYRYYL
jgi:hypothetical protein